MNRRDLFKSATLAGMAAAGALPQQSNAAPSDRLGIGVIGCGGMGRMDLADFQKQPDAEIVAVCDVYEKNLQAAHKLTEGKVRTYSDFRKLLEDRAVNAVIIATPDHWHPHITVTACEAHKDVYVEKPISNVVREGRLMVEAARRNQRIVQVGLQQRSGSHFQRCANAPAISSYLLMTFSISRLPSRRRDRKISRSLRSTAYSVIRGQVMCGNSKMC